MANTVSLETDATDNWKLSKKRGRERIDGIVATIMALGMSSAMPVVTKNFCETHDLEFA
jgi:phage terminase large subunit-like protein